MSDVYAIDPRTKVRIDILLSYLEREAVLPAGTFIGRTKDGRILRWRIRGGEGEFNAAAYPRQ